MKRHYELAKYFKGGSYLDVGCFDSILPIMIAQHPGNKVYAIDYAPKLIAFMKERFHEVNWIHWDVTESIPLEYESMDYIVAGEFLEHLEDPKAFIKEAMQKLKPGGWLAISTPLEEIGHSVGGPLHVWQFTEEDIKEMGFTEVEIINEPSGKTILAWQQKSAQSS